jgi:hypothetical protein
MTNPAIVNCPKDIWTKVATNQTVGVIHILKTDPHAYYVTYRVTADPAPITLADSIPFTKSTPIAASAGSDYYIRPVGIDGQVRVDL